VDAGFANFDPSGWLSSLGFFRNGRAQIKN
jgi:hypothetical protein